MSAKKRIAARSTLREQRKAEADRREANEPKLRRRINAEALTAARRVAVERGVAEFDEDGPTPSFMGLLERERRRAERQIRGEHEQARELYIAAGKPVPAWVLA